MTTQGRVTVRRISSISPAAIFPSRYSSRYFIARPRAFGQPAQFLKVGPRPPRFLFVQCADREPGMHDDVVADLRVREVGQAGFARHAAEIHLRHPHAVGLMKLDDLSW